MKPVIITTRIPSAMTTSTRVKPDLDLFKLIGVCFVISTVCENLVGSDGSQLLDVPDDRRAPILQDDEATKVTFPA
jgi:hypothetical protein